MDQELKGDKYDSQQEASVNDKEYYIKEVVGDFVERMVF